MENQPAENDNTLAEKDDITSTSLSGTAAAAAAAGSSSREEDSTEVQVEADARCYVPLCGLVFYIMSFFGLLCVFSQRVSLSVAIVAMVNHTAVSDDGQTMNNTSNDTDECPRDEALKHSDGEFTWDRHQQAAALAMFSYGQVISQVHIVSHYYT